MRRGPDLSQAETLGCERARACLELLRQLPGFDQAYVLSTGPQVGIRESRRPLSRGDVTIDDGAQGRRHDDAIVRAGWPMEIHEAPGRARYIPLGGEGFFDIRSSALQPQGLANLHLGGRVIGSDRAAYGAVRVMGTAFATGHAAGIGAALQARGAGPAHAAAIRSALTAQGTLV